MCWARVEANCAGRGCSDLDRHKMKGLVSMTPDTVSRSNCDVIIVGGGATGCVLAARLAGGSARRVAMSEAGPHYENIARFPPELIDGHSLDAVRPDAIHNWSFIGSLRGESAFSMPRGRVMGGTSTMNGSVYVRAPREYFDAWAGRGFPLWSCSSAL